MTATPFWKPALATEQACPSGPSNQVAWAAQTALLGLLYAVAGWVGLRLAVPPGYATVIWPASGIALAGLLLVGRSLWPGILVGSFAVNAVIGGVFKGSEVNVTGLINAIVIASGSTAQALFAAFLVRRRFGNPIAVGGPLDLLRLAMVCGPIACLVAASVGVSTLSLTGVMPGPARVSNWLTWWIGDLAGIAIILPIALFGPWKTTKLLWRGHPVAPLTATMMIGLTILLGTTLAAWKATTVTTYQRNLATFQTLTDDSEQALLNRLRSYRQSLDGAAALFEASQEVSKSEWKKYVGALDPETSLPGISGIGFIQQVKRAGLSSFMAETRKNGIAGMSIHPNTGRPDIFAITYLEPEAANAKAIGLDIAFENHRRQAAIDARDTGKPTITKPISLVQDTTKSSGFLLLRPIYAMDRPRLTVPQRRAAFRGWVYAPFIAPKFMANLSAGQGETFAVTVYDGPPNKTDNLIYASANPKVDGHAPAFTLTRSISVLERNWTVTWTSTPEFERSVGTKEPWLILASGLLLTFAFGLLLVSYSRREAYIRRQVDIQTSDLTNAMSALVESERRFVDMAELSPAAIFRANPQGSFTYANKALLDAAGLDSPRVLGSGWLQAIHDEDSAKVSRGWEYAVEQGQAFRAEFRFVHSNGNVRWIDLICSPHIDSIGCVSEYFGVGVDITNKKLAAAALAERDAQLSVLATNATDAILRMDLDGRCVYASPSSAHVLGLDPDIMIGQSLLASFHPDDAATVIGAFRDLSNGTHERFVIAYRSKTGERTEDQIWFEASAGLIRDSDTGRPKEVIASIRDITARKSLELELVEAQRSAVAGAAAKAAFLANMSHEIRTPMNGVIGFTELLLNDKLTDEQRRCALLIADSGRAMMRLLNDILDISKIDSGHMSVAQEPVDLRHKLQTCMRLMEPTAREKSVQMTLWVDPALPVMIAGDPLRIRQIVLNLLGNAVKFTHQGNIGITARKGRDGTGSPTLEIEVSDSGIGIPADRLEMIFHQFTQADESTARKYGGTGLGLSISSELAKIMGGKLTVASRDGEGSTFTLMIPLIETAPEQLGPDDEISFASAGGASPATLRVLIAEDNDVNQMLMMAMARRAGFDADIASNGEEAVHMALLADASGAPYRLVLMDMQMPRIDGLEATRQIRAAGISAERLPIVALTANAYKEDIAECHAAGMQAHFSKPVRLRDLADISAKYLSGTAFHPPGLPHPSNDTSEEDLFVEPSLEERYRARRDETITAVAALTKKKVVANADITELSEMLHKVAGTAGFFAEEAIGTIAAELEVQLATVAAPDRRQALSAGLQRFRDAMLADQARRASTSTT